MHHVILTLSIVLLLSVVMFVVWVGCHAREVR